MDDEPMWAADRVVTPTSGFAIIIPETANEFAIKEIKDRKGTENVAADHLSRIENDESSDDSEVDDNFPRETLIEINTQDEPWFANFANYLDDFEVDVDLKVLEEHLVCHQENDLMVKEKVRHLKKELKIKVLTQMRMR
nr:reverse transcriptase [Tanacetum cinerariifolium]